MAQYRCWCILCDFRKEVKSLDEAFDIVEQHIEEFGTSHKVEFETFDLIE
jgi:hypothetical protein